MSSPAGRLGKQLEATEDLGAEAGVVVAAELDLAAVWGVERGGAFGAGGVEA